MSEWRRFFQSGGTLGPESPSYITRGADDELLNALLKREYVYVLDSRQKGKSSLVARTVVKLRESGVTTVRLDLQRIGANVTPEQWYAGLLAGIAQELNRDTELFEYWAAHQSVGPLARWIGAIETVALQHIKQPIVVFIDEVDFVRALPFAADEFFAGIRDLYNRRTENPDLERLTFCIVGVATPGQLMRSPDITPFNIGRRIELSDFSLVDMNAYSKVLDANSSNGAALVSRLYYWVSGHPYLTQFIANEIILNKAIASPEDLDSLVARLFWAADGTHREGNIVDVERRLLEAKIPGVRADESRTQVLEAFGRLLKGRSVTATEEDPIAAILLLSGVVRKRAGKLVMRNRLYAEVFNEAWRRASLPNAEVLRQRSAYRKGLFRAGTIGAVVIFIVSALAIANLRLAKERESAVLSAKASETRARNESYIHTMALVGKEAASGRWISVRELLDNCRPSSNLGWEWMHWQYRLNENVHEYRVKGSIHSIFSAEDGGWYALSNQNGVVRIVDRSVEPISSRSVESWFLMGEEGIVLARHADGTGDVIDVRTGRTLYFLEGGPYYSYGGSNYALKRIQNKLVLLRLGRDGFESIDAIECRADLRWAGASRSGRFVFFMDISSGCTVVDRQSHYSKRFEDPILGNPQCARFDADESHLIISSANSKLAMINLNTFEMAALETNHKAAVKSLAFSPNGKLLVTVSYDGTAHLMDYATKKVLSEYVGHPGGIESVAFSVDGKHLMTGGSDGVIREWDLFPSGARWLIHDHKGQNNFSRLNNDATRLISISDDGFCFVYDVPRRKRILALKIGSSPPPGFLVLSDDSKFALVGGSRGEIWKVELQSGSVAWMSRPLTSNVTTGSFSHDKQKFAVGDINGQVAVLSAQSGEIFASRSFLDGKVTGTVFAPDDASVVVGCGKKLVVCRSTDLQTSFEEVSAPVSADVRSITFSKTGRDILVTRSALPYLDSYPRLQHSRSLVGHTGRVFRGVFSPSGKYIGTISWDGSARIWDAKSGKLLHTLKHESWVSTLEFSPDESRVLTASDDHTVAIWSVLEGELITQLPCPATPMLSASWSGDGSTIVAGAFDGSTIVYFSKPIKEI